MTEERKIILIRLIKTALFLLLLYFPLFLHLDALPIRLWDESRYAVNALEMNQTGNFLIPHFDGRPDMWNSKPPLLIWFQVLCIKIIGIGELSIRLPSALAALMTAAIIMWVSLKYLKDYWIGLMAALILVTTLGYVNMHGTRTGDTDALLTLFTTAYSLSFFMFLQENKKKYLHMFFVALSLAILTKGIQGTLMLPGLFILLVVKGKYRTLFNKWFFIDLVIMITIIGAYYLIRESQNPGYLKAVWNNELGGRYVQVNEGHSEAFGYYFNILITERLKPWGWILPISIIMGFLYKEEKFRSVSFFSALTIISYLIIISISKTKLEWYLLPVFPFFAILLALPVSLVFKILWDMKSFDKYLKSNIIPYLLLFTFFFKPYSNQIDRIYWQEEKPHEMALYSIGYFLQDAVRSNRSIDHLDLCVDGVSRHIDFYLHILKERGQIIDFKDWHHLGPGDHVISHQPWICEYIDRHYESEKVYHHRSVIEYSITGIK